MVLNHSRFNFTKHLTLNFIFYIMCEHLDIFMDTKEYRFWNFFDTGTYTHKDEYKNLDEIINKNFDRCAIYMTSFNYENLKPLLKINNSTLDFLSQNFGITDIYESIKYLSSINSINELIITARTTNDINEEYFEAFNKLILTIEYLISNNQIRNVTFTIQYVETSHLNFCKSINLELLKICTYNIHMHSGFSLKIYHDSFDPENM